MFNPVDGSEITSDFFRGAGGSYFRSGGGHSGVDFAAPEGTAIRAVLGGRVISAGYNGRYGNLTVVQHDDGTVAYYAHQSRMAVRAGQRIDAGMVIGLVGDTGNSSGPHLHFEIRRDGTPVNPMPWLDRAQDLGTGKMGRSLSYTTERDNSALMAALTGEPAPQAAMATPGGGFLGTGTTGSRFSLSAQQLGESPAALGTMLGEQARYSQRAAVGFELPMQNQPTSTTWTPGALNAPMGNPAGTGNAFNRLINAIAGKESGGNYGAVNPHSGAMGKYQIMPGNIAEWSRAALGFEISGQQFLRDPTYQDRIARHRLGMYYSKYGAAGAALAWYAGEGALQYSNSAKNRDQGAYPSMNDYVRDVLRRAGL